MATAGRSVLFSGVTVAVSLAALVLVPIPFLRSIGLGGLLIPLFSVATSLTLVPAILSAVGPAAAVAAQQAPLGRNRFWTAGGHDGARPPLADDRRHHAWCCSRWRRPCSGCASGRRSSPA